MRLPPLPTIGQVIQLYKLSAKQKLSQNFLLDLNITERMVRTAGAVTDATLIEVGSGPGSLTRSCLLAGAKQVIAVEKDSRFVPALKRATLRSIS
jgi:16S rRNA A1518/A1519 N6-dimethyltransferase RsmA/KsgA/DIM1 with predicted DNA glycosylase/AP lyase activity